MERRFESLADAIVDLTEEESVWQPPAYQHEPHDEGVGRPGTILWHLNHLEMCHRHYIAALKAMDPATSPTTAAPGELPLKQILPALEKTTGGMREAIAKLGADALTRQVRPNRSAANFIAMIARHISWHAGMIKQTRRLHAHK